MKVNKALWSNNDFQESMEQTGATSRIPQNVMAFVFFLLTYLNCLSEKQTVR